MERTCPQCGIDKPWDQFPGNSDTCYRCNRSQSLQDLYGINIETYELMLNRQDGECAICLRQGRLDVDHDQDTGEIRGLLCTGCNTFLGRWEDRMWQLRRMVDYFYSTGAFEELDEDDPDEEDLGHQATG
jgi:hypothetical protein